MKQFYETYKDYPKLAPLVREISWTFQTAGKTACYSKKESFRIKIRSNRIKSYHFAIAIDNRNRIFAYQIVSK
jgi:hypothetical protein